MAKKKTQKNRKKLPSIKILRSRPEVVFSVSKNSHRDIPKNPKKRDSTDKKINSFRLRKVLNSNPGAPLAWFVIITAVVFSAYGVYCARRSLLQEIQFSNMSNEKNNEISSLWQKLRVVGSLDDVPNEVENYFSAPEDLQDFIDRDYRQFKYSCIANNKLISPIGYELENIVYDYFAIIARTCGGAEHTILVKMNNVWTKVFEGNSIIDCDLVNSLRIPMGISEKCIKGSTVYPNPNP